MDIRRIGYVKGKGVQYFIPPDTNEPPPPPGRFESAFRNELQALGHREVQPRQDIYIDHAEGKTQPEFRDEVQKLIDRKPTTIVVAVSRAVPITLELTKDTEIPVVLAGGYCY